MYRKISFRLGERLSKLLTKEDLETAASELEMLEDGQVILETEDEASVIFDYGIYNLFRDGRNAIDRLLESDPPPEDSPEMRVLRAMKSSHYTVLKVEEAIPGVGVRAFDGTKQTSILVADVGFSHTCVPNSALGMRIYSPTGNWWMS